MSDGEPFTTFLDRLENVGKGDLAEALEACADNQEKWAAIGAHHVEVPHFDDVEATLLITAFAAGRFYEREQADGGGGADSENVPEA